MLLGSVVMPLLVLLGAGSGEREAVSPSLPATTLLAVAAAQELPPTIRTELDTFEINVGDPVALTVTIEHDAGSRVVWPDSLDLGSFELLDVIMLEPVQQDDRVSSAVRLIVTAFELGDLELPGFDAVVVGLDTAALSTDAWRVTVASVGRDESGDIRDIKGPLDMSRNWLLLVPWMLALIAVIAFGYWIYKRRQIAQKSAEQVLPTSTIKPPHEIAYAALDRLAESDLLGKGKIKEFYIAVSDIIRRYIEGRYSVDALEMATHEVLHGLEGVGLAFDTRITFERFLGDCDLVKFAKVRPALAACQEMIPRARRIVDDTKVGDGGGEEGEGGEGDGEFREGIVVSAASAAPSRVREEGGG
ncbi:MAG: hypothetical protein JSW51_07760 [Gemmatimonadota bacterium]|nr:MAG: hypothetical protein JSW51_07760 [Gemmatimonadota bacterium]